MKKWIGHYKNIIDDAGCKSIINYPWDWYASTYSNNKGVVNNSEERVRMDECWCSDTHKPYPLLKNSVIEVMNIYAKEHDRFSCVHHTDFRLNRYGVDGFMSPHCDNIHHSHGQTYGYPQATVLFFLPNLAISEVALFTLLLNSAVFDLKTISIVFNCVAILVWEFPH